jgi:hypothetical protein
VASPPARRAPSNHGAPSPPAASYLSPAASATVELQSAPASSEPSPPSAPHQPPTASRLGRGTREVATSSSPSASATVEPRLTPASREPSLPAASNAPPVASTTGALSALASSEPAPLAATSSFPAAPSPPSLERQSDSAICQYRVVAVHHAGRSPDLVSSFSMPEVRCPLPATCLPIVPTSHAHNALPAAMPEPGPMPCKQWSQHPPNLSATLTTPGGVVSYHLMDQLCPTWSTGRFVHKSGHVLTEYNLVSRSLVFVTEVFLDESTFSAQIFRSSCLLLGCQILARHSWITARATPLVRKRSSVVIEPSAPRRLTQRRLHLQLRLRMTAVRP